MLYTNLTAYNCFEGGLLKICFTQIWRIIKVTESMHQPVTSCHNMNVAPYVSIDNFITCDFNSTGP